MPSNFKLEKSPESPLDSKEIKPVNLKGDQPWIFTGRTDAEAPAFWPSDAHKDSLEKSLMLGKIKGRRRRGHQRMRWLDGNEHELAQTPGDGEGQGGLACCGPWKDWASEQQEWQTVCYLWSSSPQPHHLSLNIRQTQTEGESTEYLTTAQVLSSSKTRQIWETGTVVGSLRRCDNEI